jgi:hypothetical protein
VPWYAWSGPYSFWIPLFLAFCVVSVGLTLVVHRQWSSHEHLAYPLVSFVKALLPGDDNRETSGLLRDRRFWIAAGVVAAIYLNN